MTEKPDQKTPPYVGFATFNNFINSLRDTGIPKRIDASIMRNLSGSAQSSLLSALRYFNLIEENGTPKPSFEALITASEKERPTKIRECLTASYPFLASGNFDLGSATPQMLAEALRELGASGGTLDKAVAFFLAAAGAAQVNLSQHITKGRHSNGNRRRRRPAAGTQKREREREEEADETPAPALKSVTSQLVGKFPDFDPNWPDDQEGNKPRCIRPARGARTDRRGRFLARGKGRKAAPNRLSRDSSNGRTPAPTSEEMSVRIRRPEPPNQVDRRCWKQRRSGSPPRDLAL